MTELEQAAKNVRIMFKTALSSRGLTQVEIAKMLNTTPQQLSRAIAGNTTPKDIEIQKKLAKILDVQI